MSDFSLFSLFTAGLACLVPLTNAYTKPVGAEPKGNPIITPGLHDTVPVGEQYGITWTPTTDGTVTLVLLKGPSTNAVPQYAIAENIPNTGNYFWTPSDKLADSEGDTGYGIQLIVDSDGQYQYSTQFGISNPAKLGDYSSAPSYGSSSSASSAVASSGYAHPTGSWGHGTGYAHPTGGYGHQNTTHPQPTGHHQKPTWHTAKTTAPSSTYAPAPSSVKPVPSPTGNAASNVASSFFGLAAVAGIAMFAI